MKNQILLAFFIIIGMCIYAQNDCSDAVHSTKFEKSILSCCIKDIKNGNIVVYTKGGITEEIEASGININGTYYDLTDNLTAGNIKDILKRYPKGMYKGHDYMHYQKLFRKATSQRNLGIGFTISGLVGMTVGLGVYVYGSANLLIISTCITSFVGIPLWVYGGIKRFNNKKAMVQFQRDVNLSFGCTTNGVCLVLSF